nr:zinc finger, CCHC-type [Tanacetum cinerariifolium]
MAVAAMKHMASSFAKLKKFEGVDFRRWQKKMHFMLSSMSVVYVLTTPMPEDGGENSIVEQVRKRSKWDNDDYVCRGLILNGMFDSLFDIYQNVDTSKELWDILEAKYMAEDDSSKKFTQHKMNIDESIKVSCIIDKLPPSWKDFNHTLKHLKEELTLVELDSHLLIEESIRAQENYKPNGNNIASPSVVNMVKHNNSSRYNDHKGKRKNHDTRANPNKKPNVTCWKCEKPGHSKKDCKGGNVGNRANGSSTKGLEDGSFNPLKGQTFMSTSKLNDSILWHARLGHVHFKRMQDMSKDGLIPAIDMNTERCKTCMLTKITKKPFQNVRRKTKVLELIYSDLCDLHATPSLGNKKYFVTFIDDASRFSYVYLLHSKDEALDKFKVFKTEVELQQESLIKRFRTDRGGEYMDTLYFQFVGIVHETTPPYTPQQNGISERKNRVLKEMVNSMLSYSGRSQGFWGEAMLTAFYLLNRVPNKWNKITPYELWTKRKPNLNYLRVRGCRAAVRPPDPKLKTLGERGIECIFVGYAEHSKAYKFYVIEPNDSVAINSIIESWDAIFDEHKFSSIPRPSQRSLSDYSSNGCEDNFLEWRSERGGLYELTSGLHHAWQ